MTGTPAISPQASSPRIPRRVLRAGMAAGVLWVVSGGALRALTWFVPHGALLSAVLPATMPGTMWMWSAGWAVAAIGAGALAIAALTVAIAWRMPIPIATWLAVVLAAMLVGAATDVARVLTLLDGLPLRSALSVVDPGSFAATGAYWGVLYGWVAVLVRGRSDVSLGSGSRPVTPVGPGALEKRRSLVGSRINPFVISVLVAVVMMCAYVAVSVAGGTAFRIAQQGEAVAAEAAAAEEAGTPRTGAIPDSEADGDPVPTVAEPVAERDPAWCVRDAITLMLPGADAAKGHRMATLMAVNISDAPCVLEGYPDIAFGDQNGHLLDVTVERGSSFMAQDRGAAPVMLQPGESAVAYLGWNANSTQEALVAAELHAAPIAGDARDTWRDYPLPFDLVPGSTAAVTAWEFAQLPGTAD